MTKLAEREPELLVEDMPPIQAHATFQGANALATVTRMPVGEAIAEAETPFQMVMRLASDPNFSIEKMNSVVAMIREQEKDEQRKAFNRAMKECQVALKPIIRNAENKQTKSWYSTLDKIAEGAMPIITQHGFSVTFNTGSNPIEGHYKSTGILAHDGGFERYYEADVPIDAGGLRGNENKTKTHAFKSTITYGRSILICNMFNITTKNSDDDGNAAGGKAVNSDLITPQQVETLQKRIISCGINVERFFKVLQIEKLEQLTVGQFDEAMQILAAKEAKDNKPTLRENLQASLDHERGQR